jgi:mutual gliding-motility protein MglA
MVFFNYSTMQMAAKIVYYGPGLCGKTTNLHWIYSKTANDSRGEMVSLETETDRTLFFDLLPIDVGQVAGFNTRIQLYTVPGQVFYNTTRKLVLKGVDGVVFVADSQRAMLDANVQSFKNLEENLAEMGLSADELPLVLQYNKRDLADICSVEELDETLNRGGWPCFEAVAIHGQGVFETLKGVSRETLLALRQRLTSGAAEAKPAAKKGAPAGAAGRSAAAPPAAPASGAQPGVAAASPKPTAAKRPAAARPEATRPEAARPATAQQAGPAPRPPGEDTASGTTAAGDRPLRRTVDVDGELARLRREALRHRGGAPAAARAAAPGGNGKRELSRDIKLTLKRPDFDRARRFTLSFQVEDEDNRVVDSVRGLQVDLGAPGELAKVLLRLNIALQAKE